MKVYDIKAGPPTATTVLLYLQIMVSLGIPLLTEQFIVYFVSSTNKNNRHDITELLIKVALIPINQPN
jgi:hypothetical protein